MNVWTAGQYITLVTSNKQALLTIVLFFTALCVYRLITSDWAGKLIGVCILILAVYLLSGCVADSTYVTVQKNRDDAKIAVAQAQRDAEVGKAKEDRQAREYEADAKVAQSKAWANTVPVALLLVGTTLVLLLIINWQGRIWMQKINNQHAYLMARGWDRSTGVGASQYQLLLDYAQRTGREVKLINGTYYLTAEGEKPIKALLND